MLFGSNVLHAACDQQQVLLLTWQHEKEWLRLDNNLCSILLISSAAKAAQVCAGNERLPDCISCSGRAVSNWQTSSLLSCDFI